MSFVRVSRMQKYFLPTTYPASPDHDLIRPHALPLYDLRVSGLSQSQSLPFQGDLNHVHR